MRLGKAARAGEAAAPAAPPAPVAGLVRRTAATVVVCLGLFLVGIDFTVLNVAIPDLQRDLRPSLAEVQWIIDSYAVVMAGAVLAGGAVADRIGRRLTFVLGLLVCGGASVLGGLADGSAQVIAARAAMGAGSALVMPATLSIVTRLFPERRLRRRAIAAWAAVAGVGGLLGPVIGGWLVDAWSWHAGFWVNIPIVGAGVVLALWLVPESRAPGATSLDHLGVVLSAAGLTALVWGVVEGPERGWTSPEVWPAFVAAAVLLLLFALWQARARAPMLPLPLLRIPRIGAGLAALALVSFAAFGSVFILILYMQGVMGYSPWQAGLRTLPLSAAMVAGSAATVPLAGRLNPGVRPALGFACVGAAFAVLSTTTTGSDYGHLVVFEVLLGAGCGLSLTSITDMVMEAFPSDAAGLGSALNDVARQVGMGLGIAVQGAVLAAVSTGRLRDLAGARSVPDGLDASEVLAGAASLPAGAATDRLVAAAEDAFVHGMSRAALVNAIALGAVAVLVVLHIIRSEARKRRHRAASVVHAASSPGWARLSITLPYPVRMPHLNGYRLPRVPAVPRRGLWLLALLPLAAPGVLWSRRGSRTLLRGALLTLRSATDTALRLSGTPDAAPCACRRAGRPRTR